MSHSKVKNWVHVIFHTKDSKPIIDIKIEDKIHDFIKKELNNMDCYVEEINGMKEHVHILFILNQQKCLADVVKQIKGSSSHCINQEGLTKNTFAWQIGYAAFSISESHVRNVANYIRNQKEHHKKMTFEMEFQSIMKALGMSD